MLATESNWKTCWRIFTKKNDFSLSKKVNKVMALDIYIENKASHDRFWSNVPNDVHCYCDDFLTFQMI